MMSEESTYKQILIGVLITVLSALIVWQLGIEKKTPTSLQSQTLDVNVLVPEIPVNVVVPESRPNNYTRTPSSSNSSSSNLKPLINVIASSSLKPSQYNDYYPNNIVDGDPTTAWVEGVPGYGKGEWIKMAFNRETMIKGVKIMNGYNLSKGDSVGDRFTKNSRVKKAWVTFSDGSREMLHIEDHNQYQSFFFEEKLTTFVVFEINDVYRGTRWDDTCVSEISFLR